MLAPGWGTGTRGGSPPGVKLGSLPVHNINQHADCICFDGFLVTGVFVREKKLQQQGHNNLPRTLLVLS